MEVLAVQSRTTLSVPLPRVTRVITPAVISTAINALTTETMIAIRLLRCMVWMPETPESTLGAFTCGAPSGPMATVGFTPGSMVPSEAITRGETEASHVSTSVAGEMTPVSATVCSTGTTAVLSATRDRGVRDTPDLAPSPALPSDAPSSWDLSSAEEPNGVAA